MSLINDMLRDLEARHSDDLKRQNVRTEVRPLPPPASPAWKKNVIGLLFLMLVVGVGVFWGYERGAAKSIRSVSPSSLPQIQEGNQSLPPDQVTKAKTEVSVRSPGQATMPPVAVRLPAKAEPSPAVLRPTGEKPLPEGSVAVKPEKKPLVLDWASSKKSEAIQSSPPEGEAGRIEVRKMAASVRERAEGDYRLALAAFSAANVQEGLTLLRRSLQHDVDFVSARQLLAQQLVGQQRWEEAAAVLAEGLARQPRQTDWAISLARVQVEKNDWNAAGHTLEQHAEYARAHADYQGFHAHVHYRLGHYAKAAMLYQNASRLAPGEGRWWFGLAAALEADGRAGEAREAYRQALATGMLSEELSAQAMQRLR